MTLSKNPTRTRTIEKNWNREINKRWFKFRSNAVSRLMEMNSSGQISNREDPFVMDITQQRIYMAYLEQQIELLLTGEGSPNWQSQYQIQSYRRAIEQSRAELISQGVDISLSAEEIQAASGLPLFTATSSIGGSALAPIHQDALEFLFNRSFITLKGWTDAMEKEVRQILFDGVQQGQGVAEVVRNMVKRIGVSRSRARVIARTETIQAYQQSTANEAQRASEEIGEEVLIRWLTVMDHKVRHLHATFHGTLSTPEEYRKKIGLSPWNCRCGSAPVIPEANTVKKRKRFREERERLLMIERK